MTHKRTLKPFLLLTIMFIAYQFSGISIMRPYIVQILNVHGIPLDSNVITVILGATGIFANISLLFSLRFLGKRRVYIYSMIGTVLSSLGLSKITVKFENQ